MENKIRFWKAIKILLFLSVIIVISIGLGFSLWSRVFHVISHPEISVQNRVDLPASERRPLLHTIHLSDTARNQMLDGISTTSALSRECDSIFQSAFVNLRVSGPQSERVEFSGPGEPFQDSDIITPGRRFRRLIFFGQGKDRCLIYYQHGGVMYPRFCLVVIDEKDKKIIWAGEERREARNLSELRKMLRSAYFDDTSGWSC
jgi:hypothetical protein